MTVDGVMTHSHPVWRERANFIIRIPIEGSTAAHAEQLWARQIEGHTFEVCCIPFDPYDLTLGDIVETDDSYVIRRVIRRSGRYLFRVWFGSADNPPREEIARHLNDLGALVEWSSTNLLAVDAANATLAERIVEFLAERETLRQFMWEPGVSATS